MANRSGGRPLSSEFIVGSSSLLPKFLVCFGSHLKASFP
jgi:hypothetical protein